MTVRNTYGLRAVAEILEIRAAMAITPTRMHKFRISLGRTIHKNVQLESQHFHREFFTVISSILRQRKKFTKVGA